MFSAPSLIFTPHSLGLLFRNIEIEVQHPRLKAFMGLNPYSRKYGNMDMV